MGPFIAQICCTLKGTLLCAAPWLKIDQQFSLHAAQTERERETVNVNWNENRHNMKIGVKQ